MKIAVWHNLGSGGAKRALYDHIRVLKENGHYLEAWTTDISSEDFLPLSELITENRKDIKSRYDILCKIKNPIKREKRISELLNNHFLECVREIESKKFDIIFANSCLVNYMPGIGKFTSLPAILYLGEPYRPLYESMPENVWQAPYKKFRLKKIKRIFFDYRLTYSRRIKVMNEVEAAKSYDRILVNSLFSRESVIRAYGTDATVCYLGIDTEKFKPTGQEKEPYVIGIGSIGFIKNVRGAVEIIAEIPKEIRPELIWVGNIADLWYQKELLVLANKLSVRIKCLVNIPDEELISLVSRAAIMIYTSRLEPFGLAPLEANACGTYVVGVAEGGVRESITNGANGTLVNGFKKKEIAEIIRPFIEDLEYAKRKGNSSRLFVLDHWNMSLMADNILSEIKSLCREMNLTA